MRDPDDRKTGEILIAIEPEDLLKFGLIPEFVGRLPVIATLEDLDEDALVEILTKPKNALVKQYQRLFEMEDVKLTFTDDALEAIARRRSSARPARAGLRSIMESILLETMFELPGPGGRRGDCDQRRSRRRQRSQPLYIYADRRGRRETRA